MKNKKIYILFFLIFGISIVHAQEQKDNSKKNKIENCFIINFEPDTSYYIIDDILISGNKTTRDSIIYRELELLSGNKIKGEILKSKIENSYNNLRNLSLFNFVQITASLTNDHTVSLNIEVIEQWYIWPFPTLSFADRNFNSWYKNGYKFNRLILGVDFVHKNFLGLRHQINAYIQVGYDQKYVLYYQIPYLNKNKTIGIRAGGGYALQKEVAFNNKEDNKQQFVRPESGYASQHAIGLLELIYRPKFNDNFFLGVGYDYYITDDTVFKSNTMYMPDSVKNHQQFFSPYFQYKHDQRDYKHYPLKGYLIEFQAKYYTFSMISESAKDITEINVKASYFKPIAKRWFYNTGVTLNGVIGKNTPYFLQNGMGYGRNFIRGYEYYVINGQYFGILKNNFKFSLIPPKTYKFGFLKSDNFSSFHFAVYLNSFFDIGYVGNPIDKIQRKLDEKMLFGGGLGIDFVTYYDFMFRVELSMNRDKKIGLFLHLDAPL